MRFPSPLFSPLSRPDACRLIDLGSAELEKALRLPREQQREAMRRIGRAMQSKYTTAPNDPTCLADIIRRALSDEDYAVTDMLLDLHRARTEVETAVARRRREERMRKEEKRRTTPPFYERARKPLTMTLLSLLSLSLLSGTAVVLHYLYPNGLFLTSVEVPPLVGSSLTENTVDPRYFSLDVTYQYHEDSDVGTILSQSPQAGMTRRVAPRRHPCTLHLTVSLGTPHVEMGDYVGMTRYQAITACRRLGLVPSIKKVSDYPADNVARTEPKAGTVLTRGETVTLYVGSSRHVAHVAVPNLVGNSEIGALTMLSSLGLSRGKITYMTSEEPPGTVIAQSVLSGNTVNSGTQISLVVSKGSG